MSGNNDDAMRIKPYLKNPRYWQYRGRPVLLLGGSPAANLFQIRGLKEHLDMLKSVGGNYVRCSMASAYTMLPEVDRGNVWPFEKDASGRYDMRKPSAEYWRRFSDFLEMCLERDVIVQIEVWETFDFYRDGWNANPFNPKNNVNYTVEESRLPAEVTTHPTKRENPFFWSPPAEHNNRVVLKHQEFFVDALLACSLNYGNVLYCMDNETSVTPEWGKYWAEYIRTKAKEKGLAVETTEMWDPWDLAHEWHAHTLDHPETYTFVDISQNNHQSGQAHWDNMQAHRRRMAEKKVVRPMNNVKIYGNDEGRFGSTRDGQERFWRSVFGGCASARFHRPPSGLGLNETAQANIRSLRMITDEMAWHQCEPRNDLLSNRAENAAYCFANAGTEYAVYFTDGGAVTLDVSAAQGNIIVKWLDIAGSRWHETRSAGAGKITLKAPGPGFWAALIKQAG